MDIEKFWKKVEEYAEKNKPCDGQAQNYIYEGAGICEDFIKEQTERELKVNADCLKKITELEAENVHLKRIAKYQQSSNMERFFEIKKLKEELSKAKENLEYAKALMRELLDNSNEYARQNAEDFITSSEIKAK